MSSVAPAFMPQPTTRCEEQKAADGALWARTHLDGHCQGNLESTRLCIENLETVLEFFARHRVRRRIKPKGEFEYDTVFAQIVLEVTGKGPITLEFSWEETENLEAQIRNKLNRLARLLKSTQKFKPEPYKALLDKLHVAIGSRYQVELVKH